MACNQLGWQVAYRWRTSSRSGVLLSVVIDRPRCPLLRRHYDPHIVLRCLAPEHSPAAEGRPASVTTYPDRLASAVQGTTTCTQSSWQATRSSYYEICYISESAAAAVCPVLFVKGFHSKHKASPPQQFKDPRQDHVNCSHTNHSQQQQHHQPQLQRLSFCFIQQAGPQQDQQQHKQH